MKVLGIETSCDETAISVVEGNEILTELVASQIDIHSEFGGVVPELASREHLIKLNRIIESGLKKGKLKFDDIDAVAVTSKPGLEGSLLVGLTVARTISYILNIPLIEVDHLEAHMFASFFTDIGPPPGLGLIISGGHTRLVYIKKWGDYEVMGNTKDDAIGECFDKVGSMLGLSYPGGPAIEKIAIKGNASAFRFPVAKMSGYDFSYSGIKTSVLYKIKYDLKGILDKKQKKDLAASFQEAAFKPLINNSLKALKKYSVNWLLVCGGVAANGRLRKLFDENIKRENLKVIFPSPGLCTDNATMVAACGGFYLS